MRSDQRFWWPATILSLLPLELGVEHCAMCVMEGGGGGNQRHLLGLFCVAQRCGVQ